FADLADVAGVDVELSADGLVGQTLLGQGADLVGLGVVEGGDVLHEATAAAIFGHVTLSRHARWGCGSENSGTPSRSRPAARSHQASQQLSSANSTPARL